MKIIAHKIMDNNPQPRPGFRPGHETDPVGGAAPEAGMRVPHQAQVNIKGAQFVMHHPKHKYGVMLATAVIDGVEKTYAGSVKKDGSVKKWWGIPTPRECAPGLFAKIKKDLEG